MNYPITDINDYDGALRLKGNAPRPVKVGRHKSGMDGSRAPIQEWSQRKLDGCNSGMADAPDTNLKADYMDTALAGDFVMGAIGVGFLAAVLIAIWMNGPI